jgi:hypothetical protein
MYTIIFNFINSRNETKANMKSFMSTGCKIQTLINSIQHVRKTRKTCIVGDDTADLLDLFWLLVIESISLIGILSYLYKKIHNTDPAGLNRLILGLIGFQKSVNKTRFSTVSPDLTEGKNRNKLRIFSYFLNIRLTSLLA